MTWRFWQPLSALALLTLLPFVTYGQRGSVVYLLIFFLLIVIFARFPQWGPSPVVASGQVDWTPPLAVWPLFGFLVWALLSITWSLEPLPVKGLSIAACWVGAYLAWRLMPSLSKALQKHFLLFILIALVAAVPIYLVQFSFEFPLIRAIRGEFSHTNIDGNIAFFLPLLWPIAACLQLKTRRWWPALLLVSVALLATLLGHLVSAIAAIFASLFALLAFALLRRWAVLAVFATLFVYFAGLPWINQHLAPLRSMEVLGYSFPNNWNRRLAVWEHSSQLIAEAPIAGYGLRSSRHLNEGVMMDGGKLNVMLMHPHNAAVQIWLELGAVGFLFAAAFLVLLGRHLWRARARPLYQATALASFVSFVVISLISWGLSQVWWHAVGWLTLLTFTLVFGPTTQKGDDQSRA